MKYVAHLSTGGTVEIEIDGDENLFAHVKQKDPRAGGGAGWLVGNHGEMINLDYCAALVPVLTDVKSAEPKRPNILVDSEGDWWKLQEDGKYRLYTGTDNLIPCDLRGTYEEIMETYEIDHIVD